MEKIFNFTSTFKALEEDDGGVHICGMASMGLKKFGRAYKNFNQLNFYMYFNNGKYGK